MSDQSPPPCENGCGRDAQPPPATFAVCKPCEDQLRDADQEAAERRWMEQEQEREAIRAWEMERRIV